MEGWLRKQGAIKGGIQGHTRTRYFRLTPGSTLRYWRSPEETVPLGTIELGGVQDVSAIEAPASSGLGGGHDGAGEFGRESDQERRWFQIVTAARTFVLQAETEFSMWYWINALLGNVSQNSVVSRKSSAFVMEYLQGVFGDDAGALSELCPPAASDAVTGAHCTALTVRVACSRLAESQLLSQRPSAQVLVSRKSGAKSASWLPCGETEIVAKSSKPTFFRTFAVDYDPEQLQQLKFDAYDCLDDGRRVLIGTSVFVVGEILHARDGCETKALLHASETARRHVAKRGDITVYLDETETAASSSSSSSSSLRYLVELQVSCRNLPDVRHALIRAPPDPVLVLQRSRRGGLHGWIAIYRSKLLKATQQPRWNAFTVLVDEHAFDQPLRFEVRSGKRGQYLGSCELRSFRSLLACGPTSITLKPSDDHDALLPGLATRLAHSVVDAADVSPGTLSVDYLHCQCQQLGSSAPALLKSGWLLEQLQPVAASSSGGCKKEQPLSASSSLSSKVVQRYAQLLRACWRYRWLAGNHAEPLLGSTAAATLVDELDDHLSDLQALFDAAAAGHAANDAVVLQHVALACESLLDSLRALLAGCSSSYDERCLRQLDERVVSIRPLLAACRQALADRPAAATATASSGKIVDLSLLFSHLPSMRLLSVFCQWPPKALPYSILPRSFRRHGFVVFTSPATEICYPGLAQAFCHILDYHQIRYHLVVVVADKSTKTATAAAAVSTAVQQPSSSPPSHSAAEPDQPVAAALPSVPYIPKQGRRAGTWISSQIRPVSENDAPSTWGRSRLGDTAKLPSFRFTASHRLGVGVTVEPATITAPAAAGTSTPTKNNVSRLQTLQSFGKFAQTGKVAARRHETDQANLLPCLVQQTCEWGCPAVFVAFGEAGVPVSEVVSLNPGVFAPSVLRALVMFQVPFAGSCLVEHTDKFETTLEAFRSVPLGRCSFESRERFLAHHAYPAETIKTLSVATVPSTHACTVPALQPVAQYVFAARQQLTDGFCNVGDAQIPGCDFVHVPAFDYLPDKSTDDPLLLLVAAVQTFIDDPSKHSRK